uniref:HMT-2 n=1 Tax=Arundo donax TaxID=35708 RepID=A0A0A9BD11_ARUDO
MLSFSKLFQTRPRLRHMSSYLKSAVYIFQHGLLSLQRMKLML